jgi:hypothetical protein
MEWEQARKPQELKLLECYEDVMRIARDGDTKGSGVAKAKKAKPACSSARPATRSAPPAPRSTTRCSAMARCRSTPADE